MKLCIHTPTNLLPHEVGAYCVTYQMSVHGWYAGHAVLDPVTHIQGHVQALGVELSTRTQRGVRTYPAFLP